MKYYFLERYKSKKIDIIGNPDSDSRFTEFFSLIKTGMIKTDADAIAHFYDKDDKNAIANYRSFKKRFKEKLLNTLYFIDVENPLFSDFQKAYYAALHEWGAINILYRRNIIHAANKLAEELLGTCIKYELTELSVLILDKLKSNAAFQTGDKIKYKAFSDKFSYYKDLWQAEQTAQEAFENIRIDYVNSNSRQSNTISKIKDSIEHLNLLRTKHDSFIFLYFYYAVKEAEYSAQYNWAAVLNVCDEALFHFKNKPFSVKSYTAIFYNQKVIALFMLKNYQACKTALEEVLKLQEIGNINWFKTMEKKMLLALHTQAYEEANDTYKYILTIKEFKNLKGFDMEIWHLFEVYLYFISCAQKLSNHKARRVIDIEFQKFRLNKFLNNIPLFSKDTKGMKVPVLIAQICIMIIEGKYDMLIDSVEKIEKYVIRNVAKDDTISYRSNLFIKTLLEIPKANFSTTLLLPRTNNMIKNLTSVPHSIVEKNYKIEILPYEVLWKEILHSLDAPRNNISSSSKK